jgi:lysophospholipase L1-like esterase
VQRKYNDSVVTALSLLILGILAAFFLDALIFRVGPYPSLLEPESTAGQFESILRREKEAQTQYGDNLVATLGDSRFGYYPRVSAQISRRTGIMLRNAGIAGTDARIWYYMMRDLDPAANRYRAIVIGVNDYDDEDEIYNPADDLRGLHYTIAHLRLTDIPGFAGSFESTDARITAFRGALFKGLTYQTDLLAFLAHPRKRLAWVRLYRTGYPIWTRDYIDSKDTMVGLQIDWATLKVTLPPNATQNQHDTVESFLARPPAPQTGKLAAFRRKWFGKIVDRYRGSRTKVIFVRLARGPIPRPANLVHKLSGSIREFASRPNVIIDDEHAFESLEHPELYKDGAHLNDEGDTRFSIMLSEEVSRLLEAKPGPGGF